MTVLVVNRSQTEAAVLVELAGFGPLSVAGCWTVADDDRDATNSAEAPERVVPQPNHTAAVTAMGEVSLQVPPISWTLLSITAT